MSARYVGPFIASVIGAVGGVYTFKPALVEERNRRISKLHERASPAQERPSTEIQGRPRLQDLEPKSGSSSS